MSTFGVFWPITDVHFYVLLWAIPSCKVTCFKCIFNTASFVKIAGKQMDLHSLLQQFLSGLYPIFIDNAWYLFRIPPVRSFSNHSFDGVLHGHQSCTIPCRHFEQFVSIHEQIEQLHSLCGRQTWYHFFAALTSLCIYPSRPTIPTYWFTPLHFITMITEQHSRLRLPHGTSATPSI